MMLRHVLAALLLLPVSAVAQQHPALTSADYARAESFLLYKTNSLVFRTGVRPTWLSDNRFWYRNTTGNGSEFILVDPANGARVPAFNHAKLAAALSAATGSKYDGGHLPFTVIRLSTDRQAVSFNLAGRAW